MSVPPLPPEITWYTSAPSRSRSASDFATAGARSPSASIPSAAAERRVDTAVRSHRGRKARVRGDGDDDLLDLDAGEAVAQRDPGVQLELFVPGLCCEGRDDDERTIASRELGPRPHLADHVEREGAERAEPSRKRAGDPFGIDLRNEHGERLGRTAMPLFVRR